MEELLKKNDKGKAIRIRMPIKRLISQLGRGFAVG
jgi:hypothetical protein